MNLNDKSTGRALDDLADRLERGSIDIGARTGWDTALPVPDNRIALDGSLLLIADYPELYAVYSTTYGGDGVTTFALPTVANMITRVR
jgi:hypothetical protein